MASMLEDRLANAPCSWGVVGRPGDRPGYAQMLDELAAAGYRGTELGDYGYMPTDPVRLAEELAARHLTLLGAYVAVDLADPEVVERSSETVMRVATNLALAGGTVRPPLLILADDDGVEPVRAARGGRISAAEQTDPALLAAFGARIEAMAARVADTTGLRLAIHPHVGSRIETPEEIEGVLAATDPRRVGLIFDTAHYVYGTGRDDVEGAIALEGVTRFLERITSVHVKDCSRSVAQAARAEGWSYDEAIAKGLFCELGEGSIDFVAVLLALLDAGYDDWLTVEQDVFPGMGTSFASAVRNRERLLGWLREAQGDTRAGAKR